MNRNESNEWHNPYPSYPLVNPEDLATVYLEDCADQLCRSERQPLRLVQAAKSAHLALHAALTSAVGGPVGMRAVTGLSQRTLFVLERDKESPAGEAAEEELGRRKGFPDDRVYSFQELLRRGKEVGLPESRLALSARDEELLLKLNTLRDRVEHVRPSSWLIEPAVILEILPTATNVIPQLLRHVLFHHEEQEQIKLTEALASEIAEVCSARLRSAA